MYVGLFFTSKYICDIYSPITPRLSKIVPLKKNVPTANEAIPGVSEGECPKTEMSNILCNNINNPITKEDEDTIRPT